MPEVGVRPHINNTLHSASCVRQHESATRAESRRPYVLLLRVVDSSTIQGRTTLEIRLTVFPHVLDHDLRGIPARHRAEHLMCCNIACTASLCSVLLSPPPPYTKGAQYCNARVLGGGGRRIGTRPAKPIWQRGAGMLYEVVRHRNSHKCF